MSRLTLRLPNSLHEQLKEAAKREGVSLNQYVVYALAQRTAPGFVIAQHSDEDVEAQAEAFNRYLKNTSPASEEVVQAFLKARADAEPDVDTEVAERLQGRLREAS